MVNLHDAPTGNLVVRALALLMVLASCTAATDESTVDVGQARSAVPQPALLDSPSDKERLTLAAVVAAALGRDRVLLAEDALVDSSELIIERQPKRRMDGLAEGYRLDMPERFRLMIDNGKCFLERVEAGGQLPLVDVTCIPADG